MRRSFSLIPGVRRRIPPFLRPEEGVSFVSVPRTHREVRVSRVLWLSLAFLVFAGTSQAGRPDRGEFLSARDEVRRLAVERIRSAGSDYERVIVAAENRTRLLHENFQVEGGTPPTRLDWDLGELRGACQKMQRLAAAKRAPLPDPMTGEIIKGNWTLYRGEIDVLLRRVLEKKGEGPESRIYWETLSAFEELKKQIGERLLFNTPPGKRSLADALAEDEDALLVACEILPKKTRGLEVRVSTPREFSKPFRPDIQAFFRSQDMVPDARPLRSGLYSVPPGSRTVTLREEAARLVFRPKKGKGVAFVGQTETDMGYEYLAIPPGVAYYFENTGAVPLELEFVGIKQ